MTSPSDDDEQSFKTYTLQTSAPYHVAREFAIRIAMDAGHTAFLEETGPASRRPHWGRGRWLSVLVTLAGAPFVFHEATMPPLGAYGIGWAIGIAVALARR